MNSWRDILSDRGERPFRCNEMRHVVHLAVDTERSAVWLCRKGRDGTARMRQIGVRRREAFFDRRDLIGMNRDAPDKAIPPRDPAAFRKTLLIPEVAIQRIERLNPRGPGSEQALRPRHLIWERPLAVRLLD